MQFTKRILLQVWRRVEKNLSKAFLVHTTVWKKVKMNLSLLLQLFNITKAFRVTLYFQKERYWLILKHASETKTVQKTAHQTMRKKQIVHSCIFPLTIFIFFSFVGILYLYMYKYFSSDDCSSNWTINNTFSFVCFYASVCVHVYLKLSLRTHIPLRVSQLVNLM